jgi:predicted MFS family arabinose efflux permease
MHVKRLIVVLGLAGFIVMADNWVVAPLLPSIARTFSVDPVRAGVLIAAYMLPFGLFQLLYGPLADRYGKLRVVLATLAFFSVATALGASAAGLGSLTTYRALTGLFAAATMPVSLALIGDLVPMRERQKAIAGFMGIAFLGQATSMTIGSTIATVTSWRGVFIAYAVVAAVVTVALFVTTRRFAGQLHGDPNSEFLRPYGRLLGTGRSLRTYLVVLFEGLLILGSFSYAGAFAARELDLGTLEIGLLMALFGVGVIVAARLAGRLSRRLGRPRLVGLGILLAAAGDLIVAGTGSNIVSFGLFTLLLGLGFMFAHSSLLTTATEFAERSRGAAMSLVAFAFMVGGAAGTTLGGRLIMGHGYQTLYLLFGFALAALAVVSVVAVPAHREEHDSVRTDAAHTAAEAQGAKGT